MNMVGFSVEFRQNRSEVVADAGEYLAHGLDVYCIEDMATVLRGKDQVDVEEEDAMAPGAVFCG